IVPPAKENPTEAISVLSNDSSLSQTPPQPAAVPPANQTLIQPDIVPPAKENPTEAISVLSNDSSLSQTP
ncbi:hypothetical protein, partial [Nostoc sp. 2RC]|uniref:hypothetical protein n=1 Tax=Nostoc sp. 2RC TaxID=2485484 RepID=UPI00183657CA